MNLTDLINTKNKPALAVLIDPDKYNPALIDLVNKSKAKFFFVGGSKLKKNNLKAVVLKIKTHSKKPVIIFPGDETQISNKADGILILSLISGRNPDYLIGKHVIAAGKIKKSGLSTFAVGYILIDGKKKSTTQKITKTPAINAGNLKQIVDTAVAGELLGLQAIYLEAGSGAKQAVNTKAIRAVKSNCKLPLIVGGGITTFQKAKIAISAGADVIVVGNVLEKNTDALSEIQKAIN